jgi:hypothetical protein
MREAHVLWYEMSAVRLEPRIMIGRWCPGGGRNRLGIEMLPPFGTVALGHLASELDDLTTFGHLNEDTADTTIA